MKKQTVQIADLLHMRIWLVAMCIVLMNHTVVAQQKNIPIQRYFTQEVERSLFADSTQLVHTACKPVLESRINLMRIAGYAKDSLKVYETYEDKVLRSHLLQIKLKEKIFDESLVEKKTEDIFIAIDPIFDFSLAFDFADTSIYADTTNLINNTRGVQIVGDLGEHFSFQTGFYENQTFLPLYLKAFADSTGVMPGMGRTKPFPVPAAAGYDYAMAYGNISYSPTANLNFQFGHTKNFVGHGYRSLLLSDASMNYPYLKATVWLFDGKVQYTAAYASLQSLERLPLGEVPEALFKRKGYSYNYLSWMPTRKIELGLFEAIVWKRYDEEKGAQPQHYGAYLPVIGFNTAVNGLHNVNNVLLGANAKWQLSKSAFVYGQIAADDPGVGAVGYQAGIKYFDLLLKYLDIQIEWNSLGDNLYASEYALQSYTHTNQPLGHPTGPATNELVGILNYRWHRVIAQVKYNQIAHGTAPEGSWRNNPAVVTETFAPWPVKQVQQWELQAGVYLNPKTNLQLLVGWTDRVEKIDYNWQNDFSQHTSMLYIALRTGFINRYADF
ncbi:MAG: hypothetical protein ACKVOR_03825 [Flavobacteriales bacterium]